MIVKLLLLAVALSAVHGNAVSRQGNLNTYELFTLSNQVTGIPITPADFDVDGAIPELVASNPTVFIVHGHGGDRSSTINPTVKNAFMLRGEAVNVIVVDWSSYTKLSYSTAVTAVPSVGVAIGEFIAVLAGMNRIRLDNTHLIGFNLGAHVVGFAGETLNGEVARITGLDPSGSQWGSNTPRLSSGHAKYVEVIHTDGGGIGASNGIGTAIGDIDIFVNGGKNQPGCLTHACSHGRAWDLYAATLVRETALKAMPCRSTLQMNLNNCNGFSVDVGGVEMFKLGDRGIYRVNTNRSFPY